VATVDFTVFVDTRLATKNNLVKILGRGELKTKLKVSAHKFTASAKAAIEAAGLPVRVVNKVKDGRPHIVDLIKNGEISLVFTTVDETRTAIADSRSIRTSAQANGVTYYTTISAARAVMDGLMASQNGNKESLEVYSLQNLHLLLI
jgi:carbamoyl-phosphate synthase large subunit